MSKATWPEHFNRSEMNLSHVTKFQQGLGMALLPKVTKRLKRASIATKEIINFFSTCVRQVIEYACPVVHNSLPSYLSDELEGL